MRRPTNNASSQAYLALEDEHANLVLIEDAVTGLKEALSGKFVSDDELDAALGVTRASYTTDEAVDSLHRVTRLDGRTFLRQAAEILEIVEKLGEGPTEQFMFQPNASLDGMTPIEALSLGWFEQVKQSATRFTER